jgi:hypothetical protein
VERRGGALHDALREIIFVRSCLILSSF